MVPDTFFFRVVVIETFGKGLEESPKPSLSEILEPGCRMKPWMMHTQAPRSMYGSDNAKEE